MNHKMLNFSGIVCNISEGSAKVFHYGGLLRSSTKSRELLRRVPEKQKYQAFSKRFSLRLQSNLLEKS